MLEACTAYARSLQNWGMLGRECAELTSGDAAGMRWPSSSWCRVELMDDGMLHVSMIFAASLVP